MVRGTKGGSSQGPRAEREAVDYWDLKSLPLPTNLYIIPPHNTLCCKECNKVPTVPYKCKECSNFVLCYGCAVDHYGRGISRVKIECYDGCGSETTTGVEGRSIIAGWKAPERALLESFQLRCPYSGEGCTETGIFESILAHVDGPCGHHPISCELCVAKIPRQGLASHNGECPEREVTCSFDGCRRKLKARELSGHQALCGFRIVKCEDCQLGMSSNNLQWHIPNCPKRRVDCGICGGKVPFDTMEQHLSTGHMNKLVAMFQDLKKENEAVKKKLTASDSEVRDLKFCLFGIEVEEKWVDKKESTNCFGEIERFKGGGKYKVKYWIREDVTWLTVWLYDEDGKQDDRPYRIRALHPTDPTKDITCDAIPDGKPNSRYGLYWLTTKKLAKDGKVRLLIEQKP